SSASATFSFGSAPIRSLSSQRLCGPTSAGMISNKRSMTTVAENDDTERPLALAEVDRLLLRIQSAMVLGPLPIAAIWFGSPWLPLLTGLAAAVMAWEWGRLCRQGHFDETGVVLVGVVLAVVATAELVGTGLAIAAALVGAATVFWTARMHDDSS